MKQVNRGGIEKQASKKASNQGGKQKASQKVGKEARRVDIRGFTPTLAFLISPRTSGIKIELLKAIRIEPV